MNANIANRAKPAAGKPRAERPAQLLAEMERQRNLLELRNEELSRAHADLEVSNQRFSELHEQAPVGYLTFDAQGCVREINMEALRLLGVRRSPVLGKPFIVYVEKADRKKFLEHLWKIRRATAKVAADLRLCAADGTVLEVRMTTGRHLDTAGHSTLFLSTIEDVTELRAASANAAFLASIVEYSQDAIMSFAPDGLLLSWNRGAAKIFGYVASEVIGKPGSFLVPPDRRAENERALKAAGSGRATPSFDTVRLRKDGWPVDVGLSFSPIFEGNRVAGIMAFGRDITVRKRAEDALRKLNAELEERVAERTAALLASTDSLQKSVASLEQEKLERRRLEQEVLEISEAEREHIGQELHDDLGQRLAGVWFFAVALEKNLRARSAPEADAAAKIAATLDQSLALTRSLAHGLQPVMPEAGGLMAALRELAARSSELFKVRCKFASRIPVPVHDPGTATHLYRIAQEAVSNAARHGHAKHISIVLSSAGDDLLLSVTDDGDGIAKSARGSGGMGIRTMHYRAESLGGSLSFHPRSRGGTNVICAIPKPRAPKEKEH